MKINLPIVRDSDNTYPKGDVSFEISGGGNVNIDIGIEGRTFTVNYSQLRRAIIALDENALTEDQAPKSH